MSIAVERFQELRRLYRATVPSRKIGAARKRDLAWAAALTLVVEQTEAEIALGRRSEAPAALEVLRRRAQEHLAAAHARTTIDEAMRRFETC